MGHRQREREKERERGMRNWGLYALHKPLKSCTVHSPHTTKK